MPLQLTKLGLLCHQRRTETCRTIAMMAAALGMEAEHISSIEHGDTPVTDGYIEQIAEYFSLRYEYLLPYAYPERYSKVPVTEHPSITPIAANVIDLDERRP